PGENKWNIWFQDMITGKVVRQLAGYEEGYICSLAFSPDNQILATGGWYQPVHLWDVGTGKERFSLEKLQKHAIVVAFSPDGKVLASGDTEGVVVLWEISTGRVRRRLGVHQGAVNALAFSPDGKTVASGSSDSTALIWDL